ncbi:MAG: S-layer homology domain-containing protein [Clostridia bacterium]|nr:S-layer homology domain-containing protein [Clostridia bacterium]
MLRKITAAFLACVLFCVPAFAYNDIYDEKTQKAAETLSAVGVLNGVGDGNFAPDEFLTREQFAKIAVCLLGAEDEASSSASGGAFIDVEPNSWARGYISYVAEKGIIAGFPDGRFGGKDIITYSQALTVLLRCLGYEDSDIGFHWPEDFVAKAEALGLNRGVDLTANEPVSRGDAAILVYNAAFCEMNGGGKKLIESAGTAIYEKTVLYGLNKSDSSIAEMSAGSFTVTNESLGIDGSEGKKGLLLVNEDDEIVLFEADEKSGSGIAITMSIVNDAENCVDVSFGGGMVSLPYNTVIYCDGEKSTAFASSSMMSAGSTLYLYYTDDGEIESGVLTHIAMEGPKTITDDYNQIYSLFNIEETPKVIRKGAAASISDIARFDVCYYSKAGNTIYAYCDKVSGIYEKALPDKAGVTSVKVSGNEYELAGGAASVKLGESVDAFAIGEYVTLLLDRSGKVADAVDTSAAYLDLTGVVLDSYIKMTDGGQNWAVNVFLTDGSEQEYTSDRDYSFLKGALAEITFENGKAVLTRVRTKTQSGELNRELMTFGGDYLASDCAILELVSNPESGAAVVRKINFSEIDGVYLKESQVIHVEKTGEMNDIALLYLKDVTMNGYEYGIITKIERTSDGSAPTGIYRVMLHGETESFDFGSQGRYSQVIGINKALDNKVSDAVTMAQGERITAFGEGRIKLDNRVFKAADDYDIYYKNSLNEYTLISKEVALTREGRVTLYGDMKEESGGRVRLVVIE